MSKSVETAPVITQLQETLRQASKVETPLAHQLKSVQDSANRMHRQMEGLQAELAESIDLADIKRIQAEMADLNRQQDPLMTQLTNLKAKLMAAKEVTEAARAKLGDAQSRVKQLREAISESESEARNSGFRIIGVLEDLMGLMPKLARQRDQELAALRSTLPELSLLTGQPATLSALGDHITRLESESAEFIEAINGWIFELRNVGPKAE